MKLRHLRGLQQYIMRLCKTGLLKYPDNMYIPETDRGEPIKWARISQHQITSEVIKKIIPELLSCSWSEMVSRKESQTTDFFCSHGWSEPFREFMATIDEFVQERKVTEDQGFWICVSEFNYRVAILRVFLGLLAHELPQKLTETAETFFSQKTPLSLTAAFSPTQNL